MDSDNYPSAEHKKPEIEDYSPLAQGPRDSPGLVPHVSFGAREGLLYAEYKPTHRDNVESQSHAESRIPSVRTNKAPKVRRESSNYM